MKNILTNYLKCHLTHGIKRRILFRRNLLGGMQVTTGFILLNLFPGLILLKKIEHVRYKYRSLDIFLTFFLEFPLNFI